MTYTVSGGALNSAQPQPLPFVYLSSCCRVLSEIKLLYCGQFSVLLLKIKVSCPNSLQVLASGKDLEDEKLMVNMTVAFR